MDRVFHYFPNLNTNQKEQIAKLGSIYSEWNNKINVISRKDIDELYERHVLHSLAIAKVISFTPGSAVLDVGTGGGFPGIPLAILFPEVQFHLVDSIGKKIKVVKEVASALNLKNVTAEQIRAEQIKSKYDFVVSRAVTAFPKFVAWVKDKMWKEQQNDIPNGILYLKGGDLEEELKQFRNKVKIYNLDQFFAEEFFKTKKLIHLPIV